jgi:hypothetical protein
VSIPREMDMICELGKTGEVVSKTAETNRKGWEMASSASGMSLAMSVSRRSASLLSLTPR